MDSDAGGGHDGSESDEDEWNIADEVPPVEVDSDDEDEEYVPRLQAPGVCITPELGQGGRRKIRLLQQRLRYHKKREKRAETSAKSLRKK